MRSDLLVQRNFFENMSETFGIPESFQRNGSMGIPPPPQPPERDPWPETVIGMDRLKGMLKPRCELLSMNFEHAPTITVA